MENSPHPKSISGNIYLGLFTVALATLMYEILLTRVFSLKTYYHFAFLAISLAMLGLTAGAILVFLFPSLFSKDRIKHSLALSALGCSTSIFVSLFALLLAPGFLDITTENFFSFMLVCIFVTIPFVFSGVFIGAILTCFPKHISKLYAADLVGAACGCIFFPWLLRSTDGPTVFIALAFILNLVALLISIESKCRKTILFSWVSAIGLGLIVWLSASLAQDQKPLLRFSRVKGYTEATPLYERWNAFARIIVKGDLETWHKPYGYNPYYEFPNNVKVQQVLLNIDAGATTTLTGFDGNIENHGYLKYALENLVHHLRKNASVLIVGSGGGRDVLSALVFNQKSITAVEINGDIIDATNRVFGDFTGHLDKFPNVHFVIDDGRSYIARSSDNFDILQVTFIDTFAATAAGAYTMTENALYTVEAWKIFLQHLTPQGILAVTRFHFQPLPGEMYRVTSIAVKALQKLGIKNAKDHILLLRHMWGETPNGSGVILVSRSPFTSQDLDIVEARAQAIPYDITVSPRQESSKVFEMIIQGADAYEIEAAVPIDISAPTDDKPFFFNMLRLSDIFNRELWDQGFSTFNMKAVVTLGIIFIIVTILALVGIFLPLEFAMRKNIWPKGSEPFLAFFALIGLGYMLIEITQMQRLSIFLGHPSYALSVVLFSLLVSSGIGSYTTQKIKETHFWQSAHLRWSFLLGILLVTGLLTPWVTRQFASMITPMRILTAIGILLPSGFVMGMAFPMGIKTVSGENRALIPWYWGINGATSVFASVFVMVLSLSFGITVAYWTGFVVYVAGAYMFLVLIKQHVKDGNNPDENTNTDKAFTS